MQKIQLDCQHCDSSSVSFMKYCTNEQREKLTRVKTCAHFRKGQVLFYEDSIPLGVHCISQGVIKLVKSSNDGREQIIRFAKGGDFLGYRALIAEEPFVASAECVEDSIACFIPREAFLEVLAENPLINKEMMRSLCHELGLADEKITSLAHKTVRQRLAETLLLLHDTFRKEKSDDHMIQIVLPREDIANIVGTATETVIRLLSEMNKEQLIELKGKRIIILDEKKLKKISEMA